MPQTDGPGAGETPASAPSVAEETQTTETGGLGGRAPRIFAWFKRFAKLWGFALFCVFIVYAFREVVLPFIFAILVAYILAPVVDRMARIRLGARTLPRGFAVITLYIGVLGVLGVFVGYFIPKLSGDFARLFREMPELTKRFNEEWLPRVGAWVDDRFGAGGPATSEPKTTSAAKGRTELVWEPLEGGKFRLNLTGLALEVSPLPEGRFMIQPPQPEVVETAGEGRWERSIKQWIATQVKSGELQGQRAIEYGQRFVKGVLTGIARLVLVLMVAAFILIDLQRIRGFIRSLAPPSYQSDYDRIAHGIDKGLSGVIRGQLTICLINGVLTYIGLQIFKVKYSLLLAGVAAVMSLVPIFGSVLSSFPIVAVALVSSGRFDLLQGVYITLWIIGIHLIEANYLNPKIMGDAAKIHPVLVVFALIAGEHTYGLVGALFAVPVASIIQTLFVYLRRRDHARVVGV